MSDALKVINNIRTLRVQARELTLDTLEEMFEKLTIVVEERREEEALFLKQQEEKQAKLEVFRQNTTWCGRLFAASTSGQKSAIPITSGGWIPSRSSSKPTSLKSSAICAACLSST